jgi:hypothetical protein
LTQEHSVVLPLPESAAGIRVAFAPNSPPLNQNGYIYQKLVNSAECE